jgi:hypothetical protein
MSLENAETVITSMAVVVIAAILLKFAVVGFERTTGKTAADAVSVADILGPASRSCGDFRLPGASQQVDFQEAGARAGFRHPAIKVEVVKGNVRCQALSAGRGLQRSPAIGDGGPAVAILGFTSCVGRGFFSVRSHKSRRHRSEVVETWPLMFESA